ncbi:MAG: SDR family oxidoreductase [Erysipelotrichaceae bacterium]|nr:SDR family oxidoreductase [Erysipelotrichaceae bacterium]
MNVVLVTGASSGIGKEYARQFAYRGYNLLLVARREELLKEIAEEFKEEYHVEVDYFTCDLAKDPKAVYDYCKEKDYQAGVLINNAGYGDYSEFTESNLDKLMGMIDINNKALVSLTYYFVKDMKERGYGSIINVGSVASFLPGPYMAVYYATKAFVMSFSMALREELRKYKIKVSVLCPAPTGSDFWKVAETDTASLFNEKVFRTTTQAAVTGYKLFETGKAYAIDGGGYSLLIGLARHMPIELCARMVGFIQSRTKKKS